jgi:hypothetical protein
MPVKFRRFYFRKLLDTKKSEADAMKNAKGTKSTKKR